jgi:SAM-dependent methyltransferase
MADELYKRMNDEERDRLTDLVSSLHQNVLDKMPARAPIVQRPLQLAVRYTRVRKKLGPVFPDILLIDADLPSDSAKAWWYSRSGTINSWSRHDRALAVVNSVFRSMCRHARASCWPDYTAATLGHVTVTPPLKRLESEAFFGRDYYPRWLTWIEENRDYDARELADWLAAEDETLESFVARLEAGRSEPLRLLDLGCGYGRHLLNLTSRHPLVAVGLDINERMITGAVDASHDRGSAAGRVSFVPGDGALMGQIQPDSFDAAMCMTNTIGNMPADKQQAMLHRLRTVLRPGGQALMSVYGESSTRSRIKSYEQVGLRVQEEGNRIVAAQGLSSECFSRTAVERLITEGGMQVGGIETIGGIGLAAIAVRPA